MIGDRQHVEPGLLHRTRELAEVRAAGQRGVQAESEGTGAMAFCGGGHGLPTLGALSKSRERPLFVQKSAVCRVQTRSLAEGVSP